MSREDDINKAMGEVAQNIETDGPLPVAPIVVLLGGALLDLARIADAVSKLVEEVPQGGDGVAERYGRLSPEEIETIEALRRGDISVVPYRGTPPALDWLHWDGMDASGPAVPANTLVDVRFRTPRKGDRVPDLIGVSPVTVQWLNTGRPTNADVVHWRISQTQVDPAVAAVYSGDDPSKRPEYNGEWIDWKPGDFKPNNHPVDLMPGHAYPAPLRVDLLNRNGLKTFKVDPDAFDWNWYPLLGGNPGNAPTDIVAWRPAQ